MNIGSLCTRRLVTIDGSSSAATAAGLMREHHVGSLVVTTPTPDGPRVLGVVTDRDLVVELLARNLAGGDVEVSDLASRTIASVSEDADLDAALTVMQQAGVRRLLVSDEAHRLVGVTSLDDLLAACASDLSRLAQVVQSELHREAESLKPTPAVDERLRIPAIGTAGWRSVVA